ncbi:MAG: response regulator [Calditrichia bacterium]
MTEIIVELIRLVPSLLWFALIVGFFILFQDQIKALLKKLSGFKAMGVELSFVKESFDEAVRLAQKRDERIVELAEKAPQWKVEISGEDKERALNRVKHHLELFKSSKILWVDDFPENNVNECRMFRSLGVSIDQVLSTREALEVLKQKRYDVVLSDMSRGKEAAAGLKFIKAFREFDQSTPVIFYVGTFLPEKGVPPYAFGITKRPDELLHLVLDALERKKY